MSKSALEDFLESVQELEDRCVEWQASLNNYEIKLDQAREKAKASLERVLDAARQAGEDLTELSSLQPPEVI